MLASFPQLWDFRILVPVAPQPLSAVFHPKKEGKNSQQGLGVTVSWSPDDICTGLLSRRMRAEPEPD